MSHICIVYYSGYGHTERIAQAITQAAEGLSISISADGEISVDDWAQLDAARAIVFGSPTYMGMVSWQFKRFAEASSKQWLARTWEDKLAGGFTVSANVGGDNLPTVQYMHTLAMQQGMLWVGQTEMHTAFTYTDGINRLGAAIGVMAQCAPTAPASAIPQGDIDTAAAYGRRLRSIVQGQIVQGQIAALCKDKSQHGAETDRSVEKGQTA